MTTGKRALIVDDSRSARVILSRMLEQHGLTVDTAESAEQALEYLQRNRPDVIFMDHLMPGMDGFQAVQAIKADPLTATIPLMMYTSQEGELYVSQARALGAVGVLPKTVRPVDVSRILYQLHLLPDRRTQRTALFPGPAAAAAYAAENGHSHEAPLAAALAAGQGDAADATATATGLRPAVAPLGLPGPAESALAPGLAFTPAIAQELQAGLRQSMQQLVKDQLAEQRRFVLATFEAFARRMTGEIRDGIARIPPPPSPELMIAPPPPRQWWPVVMTALLAVIPAVVLGYMTWQTSVTNERLAHELVETRAVAERAKADAIAAAASASATVASTDPLASALPSGAGGGAAGAAVATEYVPYGETPFSGSRLDRLRALASTLENQQFKGSIRIESFVGDFCLTGAAGEGFTVAPGDTPVAKCDLVGNPFDDTLSAAQRQSLEFANYVAMLQRRTDGHIRVEVVNAGRRQPIAYPQQDEKTTASAWNVIAAQNNRVEFHIDSGA
ncbi:MAG TPA: response regulator [Steroidobacteraceae bacterium]|nr:response regulator [Steroidobacteraceae bacterium]